MLTNVIQSYPYPIAHPYSVVWDENQNPQTRVWALHFTTYQTLKVICLPVVSQYLTEPKETEAMERKAVESLNRAIASIRCPFFNDWITLLGTLAKHLPKIGIEPCFPLSVAIGKLKQKVQPFSDEYSLRGRGDVSLLEAMLGLRNGLAHGAALPTDERCLQLLEHYVPILDPIMEAFDFLERCEIRILEQEELSLFDDEATVRCLVGAQLPKPETITLSDEWLDVFEESTVAMSVESGEVLPLYPLFFRGVSEPCAQYDGHYVMRTVKPAAAGGMEGVEDAYIYYLGVWEKFQDESTFNDLREKLEKRKVTWWIDKKDAAPWTLADSIRDYSYRTYQDLLSVKYFPDCYVEREDVMKHFRAFMAIGEGDIGQPRKKGMTTKKERRYSNGFLLIGEAGTGKTAWAAHVAQQLLSEGIEDEGTADREGRNLLFFLRGDGIVARPEGNILFLNLSEKIGLKAGDFSNFRELLEHLDNKWAQDRVQGRRLVLLLDAINEAQPGEQVMREALELVKEASFYPWCKVILTVRWEFLRVLEGKKGFEEVDAFADVRAYLYEPPRERDEMTMFLREAEKVPGVVLERLEEAEAALIYRNYQQIASTEEGEQSEPELGYAVPASTTPWEELPQQTRNVLTNPLMMHLFHQAFAGRPASSIAGEGALYRAYLDDILRRRPLLEEAAHDVVTRLFSVERSTLTDEDVHQLREQWTAGKSQQEIRILLSPVEALEQEGIIRKRVAAEGGGYRFVFQTVLEALAYRNLRRLEGSEIPTIEFWLEKATIEPPFPEYGDVFVFLFRELHQRSLYDFMASLVEKGRAYVGSALESFLKELAAEEWTPGSVSEGFQQCVQGLARQGAEWTAAETLYNVGVQLAETRYAPSAETALTATRDIFGNNLFPYGIAIPEDIAAAKMLTVIYRKLGILYIQSGRVQESEEALMWAIKVQERLCSEEPEDVEVSNNLALFLSTLGGMYLQTQRVQEAETVVKRAIEIQEHIYRENPEDVQVALTLAISLANIGEIYVPNGHAQESEKLERAIKIQERLYRKNPEDVEVAIDLAVPLKKLGEIYKESERSEEAEEAFKRAIELQERSYSQNPEDGEVANNLASSLKNLGEVYKESERAEEAEEAFKRAIEIFEPLYSEKPWDVEVAVHLSLSLGNLGTMYRDSGRAEKAEEAYKRAVEIIERLCRENPEIVESADLLVIYLTNLADVYRNSERAEEAEAPYKRIIEIRERIYTQNPEDVQVANNLASSLHNLGLLYDKIGRSEEEEAVYKRALEIRESLYTQNPENTQVANNLAGILINLGVVYEESGRAEEAEQAYKQAIEIREGIYKKNPEDVEIANRLAISLENLGDVYQEIGRMQEKEAAYKRVVEIRESLYTQNPEDVQAANDLARAFRNLGWVYGQIECVEEAESAYKRAIEIRERIYKDNPENTQVATYLADTFINLGVVYEESGRAEEAEQAYKQAIGIRERIYTQNPEDDEMANGLAGTLINLGSVYHEMGRMQEAESACKRAIEILERLYSEHPENVEVANNLAMSLRNLGEVYKEIGRAGEAEVACKRAIEIRERIYQEHPEFVEVRWRLAEMHHDLGLLLRDQGDAQGAIEALSRYLELEDRESEQKDVDSVRRMIEELQSRK